jgi:hypothetical protein
VSLEAKFVEKKVESLLFTSRESHDPVVKRQRTVLKLFKNCLKDDDIVKSTRLFKEIHAIQ